MLFWMRTHTTYKIESNWRNIHTRNNFVLFFLHTGRQQSTIERKY